MSKKIQLTSIEIKVAGATLKLSVDEAQQLYDELSRLCGDKALVIERYPYRWPWYQRLSFPGYGSEKLDVISKEIAWGSSGTGKLDISPQVTCCFTAE
jgi:hypothetical protein